MPDLVRYDQCPVCGSAHIGPLFWINDHSVTKEAFVIWQCADCSLRFTQNVPTAEAIGRYYQSEDYISHSDTNKGFINKLYIRARKFTIAQKLKFIQSVTGKTTGNLLDLGCGTGSFLAAAKTGGWNIAGVEPDEGARRIAKEMNGVSAFAAEQFYELPHQSFDAVTLWHVLEHVHDLHRYMQQLKHLLRSDGKLIIAVPNYNSVDATAYGSWWAAYDVPRHLYHFTPKAMQALASKHGFHISKQKPMLLDAFYISLLSSKYRHGRTAWFSAGFNGLRSTLWALMKPAEGSSVIYVLEKAKKEN